jgi:hypothetical protein
MSDKIRRIYNKTKSLHSSPEDLDNSILEKIHTIDNEPEKDWIKKPEFYIPVAASILLFVIFQTFGVDTTEQTVKKPLETVTSIPDKKPIVASGNTKKNKLPDIFLQPQTDITDNIVPACTGELIAPEEKINSFKKKAKKPSDLPIKPIYPYDKTNKNPECDKVSSQFLKNKKIR